VRLETERRGREDLETIRLTELTDGEKEKWMMGERKTSLGGLKMRREGEAG
jgi:hypothetical protein